MTKKILVTGVLAGVLATGAYAYGGNCDGSGYKNMHDQQRMNQQSKRGWSGHNMMGRHHFMGERGCLNNSNKMRKGYGGMQILSQLKLTNDQQFQLSILRDEMKLEMKKLRGNKRQGRMLDFISEKGFDKDSFVKEDDKNHKKMMKIKVNHMEKVFKILTKEQIAELKKRLNN